jgi:hypothetical protein
MASHTAKKALIQVSKRDRSADDTEGDKRPAKRVGYDLFEHLI